MALVFLPPVPPQEEPQAEKAFSTTTIRFGDGYAQDFGHGLPAQAGVQNWPLMFVGTDAEINPIRDFFDLHAGYVRFLWTPPNSNVQGNYVVTRYQYIPAAAGNAKLSATLEQRF